MGTYHGKIFRGIYIYVRTSMYTYVQYFITYICVRTLFVRTLIGILLICMYSYMYIHTRTI